MSLRWHDPGRGLQPEPDVLLLRETSRLLAGRHGEVALAGKALGVVEWADRYRVLGVEGSARRWDTSLTPFAAEIMDAMTNRDPACRVVLVNKAAQMGLSECLLNVELWHIAQNPCSMLHYFPTKEMAEAWARKRLEVALKQPPFKTNASLKLVGTSLLFPGGVLMWMGGGSSNTMSAHTAQVAIVDEAARMRESMDGEGDFLSLVSQRVKTFGARGKVIAVSTPIDKQQGEGTWYSMVHRGDCRVYEPRCHHCGEHFRWEFHKVFVRYEEGGVQRSGIKCPHCERITADGEQRTAAVAAGRWRPTKEGEPGIRSYMLDGLLGSASWRSFDDFHYMHQAINKGVSTMRAFYNTELGEFWNEPEARQPEVDRVQLRMTMGNYREGVVPDGVSFLTMALDVQKSEGGWLPWEVKGWGKNFENWSVARGRINLPIGDTAGVADEIRKVLTRPFPRADGSGVMYARAGAIDVGWAYAAVHEVIKRFPQAQPTGRRVNVPQSALVPVKGVARSDRKNIIVATPGGKTASGRRKHHAKMWAVETFLPKYELYQAAREESLKDVSSGDEEDKVVFGRPHAPIDYKRDYYEELFAEEIRTKKDPITNKLKLHFHLPDNVRNEMLDLHVYARSLAELLGAAEWDAAQWDDIREMEVSVQGQTLAMKSEAKRRGDDDGDDGGARRVAIEQRQAEEGGDGEVLAAKRREEWE